MMRAIAAFGGFDVWINNAGRGITRSVLDLTGDDVDEMIDVNVKSALYGMQTAAAHFLERGSGHIHQCLIVSRPRSARAASFGVQRGEGRAQCADRELRVELRAPHRRTFT